VLVIWEALKFIGGVPWRAPGAQPGSPVIWNPPLRLPFANDLNLPHIWNIAVAFGEPWQRGADRNVAQFLFDASLYTWREALIGFGLGALLGLALATVFVHSRLLERALVPYVIASQTVPIIALAPMIVFAFGANVTSVVIITTYLTFFPVTIAMIRGLRSFDPRAMELMRSYAASRGRVIITFNQYYITGPEKLWAAIIAAAILGIVFFLCVRAVEILALRGRPGAAEG
jgi:NitT/TauT family transport system permease protein